MAGPALSSIGAVVGLGNPGSRYAETRHNAGFWFVDGLARRHAGRFRAERKLHGELGEVRLAGCTLRLFKPTTYVNRSGNAVQALASYFRLAPEQLLVVHDDLDLPPGTVRLKLGGGHGGHNGLRDIVRHIGAEFARLRVGIGHPGHREGVVDYVLHRPGADEERLIREGLDAAADALETWAAHGFERAQQDLNSRHPTATGP